jgi:hypothetical protein
MKFKKGQMIIFVDPVLYTVAKVAFRGETKYHYRLGFPMAEEMADRSCHKQKTLLLEYDQETYEVLRDNAIRIRTAKKAFDKALIKEG